ncbi:MAG: phosphoribosylformylglycinamidine cyclo-ligase, partial [Acidimicrobiales bacterium]|nr:phosphoribosylformylglycinamidine cyclo-ligase [Acidimicrobiales bacterium]
VATTDGVGTKSLVATMVGRYDTIGIDLVAMCVDDLVCQGAEPLLFLDYVSVGRVIPEQMEQLVAGVADGCRQAGCALVGGEMAEHPGMMGEGEFDLVGFALGVVDRNRALTGTSARAGDVLISLPSPGLRSNGYSLARRLYFDVAGLAPDDPAWAGASVSVADELLRPSVIYAPAVLAAVACGGVRGVAHITGGGLPGNLPRALPADLDAEIDPGSWVWPRIFGELARIGELDDEELARVFNCGVGMVCVVAEDQVDTVRGVLATHGHDAPVIGRTVPGSGAVRFTSRFSSGLESQ